MERTDITINEVNKLANKYFDSVGTGRGTGYKLFQRWLYERRFHIDENGYFISPQTEWERYQESRSSLLANRSMTSNWTELGPSTKNPTESWTPGVGRISAFAMHPSNENFIYVGSPGGGLWKSIDAGSTWVPLTDNNSSWMYIFSIAIDPSNPNIIYAGTDNTSGIIKSTDAGATWSATGTGPQGEPKEFSSKQYMKILIHPISPNIVFAAANNGIWRSVNGGDSWIQVHSGKKEDIEFKPDDVKIMYATGNDVYRSVDTGKTWINVGVAQGITNSDRTLVAVTPANPNYVYIVQANDKVFGRMYKSTNGGLNFTTTVIGNPASGTNYFGYELDGMNRYGWEGQAQYDMALEVSASNPHEVYIGGINCWKSVDGALSFNVMTYWDYTNLPSGIGYIHSDVHGLFLADTTLYAITDGGLFKRDTSGTNWIDLSAGLGIRKFYRMANSQTNAAVITGGAQDNGSVARQASGTWVDWLGADGMEGLVSPTNHLRIWGTTQNGKIYRSFDGGNTKIYLNGPPDLVGDWITPLAIHPTNENILYGGWTGVWKSVDGGSNWANISSGDITNKVKDLALAPSAPTTIYASIENILYVTTDDGGTWTPRPAPDTINDIAVDPTNPKKIWIACNNAINRVFVSTDAGATFTNISSNLPPIVARTIVVNDSCPKDIYVGMNIGVYHLKEGTGNWTDYSANLPKVAINELEIQKATGVIRVATYGRGIWESPVANTVTGPLEFTVATTKISSCNTSNGSATITINNPDPDFTFEYAVDSIYSDSITFENLSAGNHIATVRYKNTQCEFSKNFTIEDSTNLQLSISGTGIQTYCISQSGQVTLTATASGGSGHYRYSWPGGTRVVSSTGWYSVTVTDDSTGCTKSTGGLVVLVPVICSRDPNDITGPVGYGDGKMVSKFVQWPYTIRFENDPEFATAPAQVVKITDPIDSNLNILSFRLGDFGFGGFNFTVPPNRSYYSARLNVIDSLGVVVDVTAGIDIIRREAFWIFESKDPATGLPPANAALGFLPVNDSITHKGEGFVNYTFKPANHTQTGDSVHAFASIVFDINEPIATPVIFNTIDAVNPVSHVAPLAPLSDTNMLLIKWSGMDDPGGSGVRFYDLFVSENGAPYLAYQSGITDTSTIFTGRYGNTYGFYSIATDNTGNREAAKLIAEQTVDIRSNLVKPYLGPDTTLRKCPGTPVNLNNPFNLTGLYAVWNTPADTAQVAPGVFTLIANNSYGLKDTATVTVIDYEKPDLGHDTAVSVCTGSTISIRNFYDTTGYAAVLWSIPNPDSAGTGVYTLIVSNTFGCSDTAVIMVQAGPTPTAVATPSSQDACSGSPFISINITGSQGNAATYNWTRDNTSTVTGMAASGTGDISGTLVNNTTAPVTVTFTITPSFTTGALTCTGTPIMSTIIVNRAPAITCPGNIVQHNTAGQCGSVVAYTTTVSGIPAPTITHVFSGATTASGSGNGSGSFFNAGVTNVTVTAANSCGTSSCSFTVTITDAEPPVLTCPGPVAVSCASGVPAPDPGAIAASDNCPGVTVVHMGDVISAQTCPNRYTITRTYRATDAANNFTECTQIITVNDQTAPTLTCPAAITVSCAAAVPAPDITAVTGISDNCAGVVTVTHQGDIISGQTCASRYTITRTYRATDACGNFAECTQIITVNDQTAPTLTCPAAITVSCAAAVPAPDITAVTGVSDNCAGVVTVTHQGDIISGQTCANRYIITRTYRATDACGNFAECTQIITVNDQTAPTLTCPAAITVSCAAAVPAPDITAVTGVSDNCAGVVTVTYQGDIISGQTCANRYTITRTYRATDVCGNFAECTQIITVSDQTAPVISCPLNITVTTPIGSCTAIVTYTVTATDNCPGAVTVVTVPASGSVFPIGVTTVTSTATDGCGNSSTCTFTVTVIDGQLPVITTQPAGNTVCAGTSTVFSAVATNALGYQWQVWNGSTWSNIAGAVGSSLTISNPTLSMNTNSYRVIVIGLCTNVASSPATLFVNPLPTISLSASAPPSLLPTQTTTITTTVNPPGGSFAWIFNGTPLTGITGPSIGPLTVDNIGVYYAIYTDLNGCIATSSDIVVSPQVSGNLYIYPNPNTGQFQIRFYNQLNEEVTVRIFDMKGEQVYLQKAITTTAYTAIKVELMKERITAGGTYIVEVRGSGGRLIGSKRIVILK